MDPFLSQILIWPPNFAPQGWALCAGQLLPISQNTALFALIGTFYGGDGISNFALPNLQGRVPIHMGSNGQGTFYLGQTGGSETVTLTQSNLPAHSHAVNAVDSDGGSDSPSGTL